MGCSRLKSCRGTNETRWATFGVLLTEQKQNTHILQECISPSYGKGWRRWGCLPRWCRFDLFHSESEADPSPCSAETWFTQLGSLTHPKCKRRASVLPQVKACYVNVLSLPGQVHQHQQQQQWGRRTNRAPHVWRMGGNIRLATETDCIIQYVNAALRFDKLLRVLFYLCRCAFLTAALQQARRDWSGKMTVNVLVNEYQCERLCL